MTDSPDLNLAQGDWNITEFSLLNPNKFKVVINLFQDTAFWAQAVNMPSITMGANKVPTSRSIDFWTPGDKIEYEDLFLTLMVDKDMTAIRVLKEWQENCVNKQIKREQNYSDLSVIFLTNNSNANLTLNFKNAFPQSISGVKMGANNTADAPLTVDVTFKYQNYTITPLTSPEPAKP